MRIDWPLVRTALLGSFLLSFPGEPAARADGLAFVTFLGVTKGDDLVFLPIEGGDGPFVWNRRDPTATVLDVPKTERLLNLTPSAGPLVLATTAKDPQTDLVRLYTLDEGARLVPAGTVPVEGRPTGAASIIDDEGAAWVFVEAYRADHAETTAYRRSGERWKRLATARTEIGVPRRSGRGEISIYGWAFEARPSRVTARIPSTVSTKPGSPIIVERFGGCPGATLSLDKEGTRLYRGEAALPAACSDEETSEDVVGFRRPVVRCTWRDRFRLVRFDCDAWREVASGAKGYFPAAPGAPADDVGQIVDRGDELLLLGHLLVDGERRIFSIASVRAHQESIFRVRVP